MSRLARERGRKYEIEVAKALSTAFGREFKRKLGQARDSGNDIDVGPFVIEAKRRRTLGTVMSWLKQAVVACASRGEPHTIPVVIAREDEGTSIVIMPLCAFTELAEPFVRQYYEEHPDA